MKRIIAIRPPSSERHMHLCWMVTNLCDFKCTYCQPSNHSGNSRGPDLKETLNFLDQFLVETKDYDLVHVSFTGGEPTLWRPFREVVQYLEERGVEVGLTSNGQRNITFWDGLAEKINWVCLSFHPETANPDKFIEVIKALESRTSVNVRVMMPPTPETWEKSLNFWKRLQDLDSSWGFFMEMVALEDNFGMPKALRPYSDEQMHILKKETPRHSKVPLATSPQNRRQVWTTREFYSDDSSQVLNQPQLVINNENQFKGWICNAGVESIFIDEKGKIFKANCKAGGLIGNLKNETFKLPQKQVICPRKACFCGTDIAIKKNFSEQPKKWWNLS